LTASLKHGNFIPAFTGKIIPGMRKNAPYVMSGIIREMTSDSTESPRPYKERHIGFAQYLLEREISAGFSIGDNRLTRGFNT